MTVFLVNNSGNTDSKKGIHSMKYSITSKDQLMCAFI